MIGISSRIGKREAGTLHEAFSVAAFFRGARTQNEQLNLLINCTLWRFFSFSLHRVRLCFWISELRELNNKTVEAIKDHYNL